MIFSESAYFCPGYDGDVGRLFVHAVKPAEPVIGGRPAQHALFSVPAKPGRDHVMDGFSPYYALRLITPKQGPFPRRGSLFPAVPLPCGGQIPVAARFEVHEMEVYAVDHLKAWIRNVNEFCARNPERTRYIKWI
jgi:hypothetical protein